MTIWILQQALTPDEEAHLKERTHLTLPFDDVPDLSRVSSQAGCRQLLQALHPDAPPETIARKSEQLWKLYGALQVEDIIAVPLNSRKEMALAEVTKRYQYDVGASGTDVHQVVVKWHDKGMTPGAFGKHNDLFNESAEKMREVTNAEARIAIRDRLPHPYNRFAKWKWLLILFFLMGLISRFGHQLTSR